MSDVIYISNARLSFPHLIEPQVRQQQDGSTKSSYNCELLLLPNDPGYAQFMQRFLAMCTEEWKANAQAAMNQINMDRKARCYGAGEEKVKKDTFQPYDGYVGHVYITVGNKNRPQMIQPNGQPCDPNNTMLYAELARKMYGGCYVNAAIKPWLQKPNPQKQYGAGVRCDLIAIQFAKDGEPFGEGATVAPDGMFGQVAVHQAAPGAAMPQMPGMPNFGAPAVPNGMPPFMGGQ